jgi:hypothetical protein
MSGEGFSLRSSGMTVRAMMLKMSFLASSLKGMATSLTCFLVFPAFVASIAMDHITLPLGLAACCMTLMTNALAWPSTVIPHRIGAQCT